MKAQPVRTCIGCRARRSTGTLVRVTLGPVGSLTLSRTAPGRGAWLCANSGASVPEVDCLTSAARRGAFVRALRKEVKPSEVALLVATVTGRARIEGEVDDQARPAWSGPSQPSSKEKD